MTKDFWIPQTLLFNKIVGRVYNTSKIFSWVFKSALIFSFFTVTVNIKIKKQIHFPKKHFYDLLSYCLTVILYNTHNVFGIANLIKWKNPFMFMGSCNFCFINFGYHVMEEYKDQKCHQQKWVHFTTIFWASNTPSSTISPKWSTTLASIYFFFWFCVCHHFLKVMKSNIGFTKNFDVTTFIILVFFLNTVMNISSGHSLKWWCGAKSWPQTWLKSTSFCESLEFEQTFTT